MLYEVITAANGAAERVALERIVARHFEAAVRPAQLFEGDQHRITSYNVCYTKLLRGNVRESEQS